MASVDDGVIQKDDEIVLEIDGLWKIFGHNAGQITGSELQSASKDEIQEKTGCVVAVRDVSFTVGRGEFFVIMGLPDSGMSTFIRCILRLTEPTAGKILVNDHDVCEYSGQQLADLRRYTIGMVFQHFGLFPHRSVIDNVAYGLKIRGANKEERHQRAREVIAKVGLEGRENQLPGALSAAEQQQVGIARALAKDPDILLMDEPFSDLDPLIRRQMQDKLLALQAEFQKTILFVTHDLDEAVKLGNRIAIMKEGEIIQIGTPEEIITEPGDPYVREFVQDASPARVITAGSIMEQPRILLYEWQGPKVALHILRTTSQDEAFLITRTGKLMGLVTTEHLVEVVQQGGVSLKEAVEPDLPAGTPEMVLEDLFPLAVSTRYPIPIVDEKDKFLGEIHTSAILINMIQETAIEEITEDKDMEDARGEDKETA